MENLKLVAEKIVVVIVKERASGKCRSSTWLLLPFAVNAINSKSLYCFLFRWCRVLNTKENVKLLSAFWQPVPYFHVHERDKTYYFSFYFMIGNFWVIYDTAAYYGKEFWSFILVKMICSLKWKGCFCHASVTGPNLVGIIA